MQQQDSTRQTDLVLVAYATRYGSTREVAEAIAKTLIDHGFTVDTRPANTIEYLQNYRAIILGAPFYLGGWHKEALTFLNQHRDRLEQTPVAIFALGPISGNEQEQLDVAVQLDKELEKYQWLSPLATMMFGGKYDPAELSISHRVLTWLPASPLRGLPANDLRDWVAIDDWARKVAVLLETQAPQQAQS